MRTTLTIDEDVAILLERLQKERGATFKGLVNEALRRGLREIASPPQTVQPFRTRSVDLGRCLIGSLDDISEVLAIAEGDDHR
jgi:hypothetical protein